MGQNISRGVAKFFFEQGRVTSPTPDAYKKVRRGKEIERMGRRLVEEKEDPNREMPGKGIEFKHTNGVGVRCKLGREEGNQRLP